MASSEEGYSPDPTEGNRLFNSRVRTSQNWVRSFPQRSGSGGLVREGYFSDSSDTPTPDIYEDRGYDYSYVTTETRKVRPKDQKILSYETTEKVPILTAPSPEVEENFEKITIETPQLNIKLPEVSAHRFGSPPRQLIENLSRSHYEFQASDAPLYTPPIEKYRQAVVDKYLADKTRGGTRTYKSSWTVGSNRGAETSVGGGAFPDRPPPEPILYQSKPRVKSSYHTKSLHTESIPGPFFANTIHSKKVNYSNRHQNHVDFSDPENYIASTVYKSNQRNENLQPLTVTYGEFSDEENTSPRSAQPSTQSDEEFVPVKVEVVRKGNVPSSQSGTKKVKRTTQTVTTTRSRPHAPQVLREFPDNYQGDHNLDLTDEIEDLNGSVEYVDSRAYRNTSPMKRSTQKTQVVREKVAVPGGGYQIRESRSTSGGRGSSPSLMAVAHSSRQGRSPSRRADTMDGYGQSRSHSGGPSREVYHTHPPKEKKFLKKVQNELEEQRGHWQDEVEKMADSFTLKNKISSRELHERSGGTADAGNNSFVDHSTGAPVFKAFVDVSDYPTRGIDVSVDNIENKVVVKASKRGADGVLRSFTQKVQLPRYSDEHRISTKLSKEGILRIEVPLMYYFQPEKKRSKSFINQVVTKPDGSKYIEVLVNVGHDTHAWNLKVLVNEKDELLILAEKERELPDGQIKTGSKLIKRYILPRNAIVAGIKSKLGRDGRLMVTVPLAESMSD